jgi:hypothetical protein
VDISARGERLRDSETIDFASAKVIAFAALNFSQFHSSQLHDISYSLFSHIVSHPSLQIQNDDSPYDVLSQHVETSPVYFSLVEYLRFEFLHSVLIILNSMFGCQFAMV